ncbi:unnamed protein product [Bursaphelenchus xylophilus]|uniref:(pine wood nematode) hypothetical protein n=1 Tax=Bursaphelenchus xylophilus TaxID=6326 RepID=A0A1I7S1E4_BURXY|nr:unnamed protein product [Bursaphelenchus xylophilus]CAG9081629.1 unnamed protein product [Bursaphelenchus xylophilus]
MAGTERILVLTFILGVAYCEINKTACGVSVHCDSSDGFDVAYRVDPEKKNVLFEVSAKKTKPEDNYVAIGFSDDDSMGNEKVISCYKLFGEAVARNSFNNGRQHTMAPNEYVHSVALIQFTEDDDHLYCSFEQPITSLREDEYTPKLNGTYNLLMATGPVNSEVKNDVHLIFHSNRAVMPKAHILTKRTPDMPEETAKVEADAVEPEGKFEEPTKPQESQPGSGPFSLSKSAKLLLLRYHGVLMLFGWFGFLYSGIFAARYMRSLWPKTTVGGIRIWFHIHRLMNSIGIVLIASSIVLVYISQDLRWTGPAISNPSEVNTAPGAIHSLIGAISVLLAFSQPLGALTRCRVDHPRRRIFNFFHRGIGFLAALLALSAAIIAVFYFKGLWQDQTITIWVLLAFIFLAVIVAVIQEVVKYRDENEQQRIVAIEMRNRSKSAVPSDVYYFRERQAHSDRHRRATVALFLAYALAGFVAATVLTYFILSA